MRPSSTHTGGDVPAAGTLQVRQLKKKPFTSYLQDLKNMFCLISFLLLLTGISFF